MAKSHTIAGIEVTPDQLRVAVVQPSREGVAVLATRCYEVKDGAYNQRAAEICEFLARHSRPAVLHFSLSLPAAMVRVIELPSADEATLDQMVGFEIERHVPLRATEMQRDYCVLSPSDEGMCRLLVVVVPTEVMQRVQQLRDEICIHGRFVKRATCSLTSLAEVNAACDGIRREEKIGVIDARLAQAEITLTDQRRHFVKRTLIGVDEDRLLAEFRRAQVAFESMCETKGLDRVCVGGDRAEEIASALVKSGIPCTLFTSEGVFAEVENGRWVATPFFGAVAAALQDTTARFSVNLFKQRDARRRLRQRKAGTVALGLLLFSCVGTLAFFFSRGAIERKENELQQLTAQVHALHASMAKRSEKDEEDIPAQLVASLATQARRSSFAYLETLRTLSRELPEKVWLTGLEGRGENSSEERLVQINLKGLAKSNDLIGKTIEALAASQTFTEVELVSTRAAKIGDREVFEFELRCVLK